MVHSGCPEPERKNFVTEIYYKAYVYYMNNDIQLQEMYIVPGD